MQKGKKVRGWGKGGAAFFHGGRCELCECFLLPSFLSQHPFLLHSSGSLFFLHFLITSHHFYHKQSCMFHPHILFGSISEKVKQKIDFWMLPFIVFTLFNWTNLELDGQWGGHEKKKNHLSMYSLNCTNCRCHS